MIWACEERRDGPGVCWDGDYCAGGIGSGYCTSIFLARELIHCELDDEEYGKALDGRFDHWLFTHLLAIVQCNFGVKS